MTRSLSEREKREQKIRPRKKYEINPEFPSACHSRKESARRP